MENGLITETVEYDAKKHYKVKRVPTMGTKDGKVALLVQPDPKDIMFDVKAVADLEKNLRQDVTEQSVGRAIAPSKN